MLQDHRDDVLPYQFRFGPFFFQSQIEVVEVPISAEISGLPVTIRRGVVPQALEGAESLGRHWINAPDQALFSVEQTARYLVRRGREVVVEVSDGALPKDVSGYLLGVVFGVLCHQNGMLPLHSSAIATGNEVTAFLGNSGAGKSTLAAFLEKGGHRVVADDICLLGLGEGGVQVIPVAGWLKLWRESLDQLGKEIDAQQQTFSDEDKYRVTLRPSGGGPFHLRSVCLLSRLPESADGERVATLEPISVAEGIAEMMNLTYLGFLPNLQGGFSRLFTQCADALKGARCFRLTVPWGWENMAGTVKLVERELLGIGR